MSGKCPRCGSEDTELWIGGIVAGEARMRYHCGLCGYFGPLRTEIASKRSAETGF